MQDTLFSLPPWAQLLIFIGAATAPLTLLIQLGELGVGIHNARTGKLLKTELRAGTERADSRGAKLVQLAESMAPRVELVAKQVEDAQRQAHEIANAPPVDDVDDQEREWKGGDPREARARREDLADLRAAAEVAIRARACEVLGDQLGNIAVEQLKGADKTAWNRAVRAVAEGRMPAAERILGPAFGRYQMKVTGGSASPSTSEGGGSWSPPF